MSDDKTPDIAGTKEPLIISPEEAKRRITAKVPGGAGGKYAISRAEAISIAVQIGQEVYDQLRGEHALAMGQLSSDLQKHFAEIRRITATNILDIQRRSFSYRIRRDFAVDRMRIAAWVSDRWDMVLAWLELIGMRTAPQQPGTQHFKLPPDSGLDFAPEPDPENIGAPTELPEAPEVARAFTLSSQEKE